MDADRAALAAALRGQDFGGAAPPESILTRVLQALDSMKRSVATTVKDTVKEPGTVLSQRLAQLAESLPSAPQSVMPGVDQAGLGPQRPGAMDWGTAAALNAPMGMIGHTVYHGSPHKFDKFDASKIGTGEGAQAYGTGLYLAENPSVAKTYAQQGDELRQKVAKGIGEGVEDSQLLDLVQWMRPSMTKDDAVQFVRGVKENPGHLYKADLPDEWLPKMLDWDKPLSQQPEVAKALKPIIDDMEAAQRARWGNADAEYPLDVREKAIASWRDDIFGKEIMSHLNAYGLKESEAASQKLRGLGVPGVRYLDQRSRGGGEGTANYVVFPGMEQELKVLERNGESIIDQIRAAAAPAAAPETIVDQIRAASVRPKRTVRGGESAIPGIYDDPRKIVEDSAQMVGPEDPLVQRLFGVGRHDLDERALQMQDFGIANPHVYVPRGAPEHVGAVANRPNAQRLQTVIELTANDPRFAGMGGWYVTDPLLHRAIDILGPEEGKKFFLDHHKFASPMSAMNEVSAEQAKGTFAHLLSSQGRLDEFHNRRTLPYGMDHPAHSTAHAAGIRNLVESGGERFWKEGDPSPKTPNYYTSKTGENWFWPTGDAHFVRATGLPDVRPKVVNKKTGERIADLSSIGKTEAYPIGEWFTKDVSGPLGLSGNIGQPVMWGGMASRTGVKSAIGAPYLEILATQIGKSAKRQGISPEQALDNYIRGAAGKIDLDPYKGYLGALLGIGVGTGALLEGESTRESDEQ